MISLPGQRRNKFSLNFNNNNLITSQSIFFIYFSSFHNRSLTSTYSAADLPKITDKNFLLWLNQHLSSASSTPSVFSSYPASQLVHPMLEILDIIWCYVQPLSKQDSLVSCCAILTSSTVFIEKLTIMKSTYPGMPGLEPMYILPMKNIQQMVIGPCHSFLRLEEAFVGKSGTFTVFCVEPQGIQRFSQKLLTMCQKLDCASDLECVDLNNDSDLLKIIAAHEEEVFGVASDRLVLMSLVKNYDDINDELGKFYLLLLSENIVYCLKMNCALWPPPNIESTMGGMLNHDIVHEFSITDKLIDLKIHPTKDELFMMEESRSDHRSRNDPSSNVDFSVFQLSLIIESSIEKGLILSPTNSMKNEHITYRYFFPSMALRDQFLDRLSNLRAEQANQMLPNEREEPEGGNEQFSHTSIVDPKLKAIRNSNNTNSNSSAKTLLELSRQVRIDQTAVSKILPPLITSSERSHNLQVNVPVNAATESFKSLNSSESSASFQSIIEYEDADHRISFDQRSSSPKEEMSVSPTSNFSRASISPPTQNQQADSEVHSGNGSRNVVIANQNQRFNADFTADATSLPSSFDWKTFYFTSSISADVEQGQSQTHSKAEANESRGPSKPPQSLSKEERSTAQIIVSGNLRIDVEAAIQSATNTVQEQGECSTHLETELESYLKKCVSSFDLIFPLSAKLKPLRLMSGSELRKFFNTMIAPNSHLDVPLGGLAEELHHVLWSTVVPYTNPKQEITSLIMLSTYAIYLVSDTVIKVSQTSRPSWMTHSRNQSDSAISWNSGKGPHIQSKRKVVAPYLILKYKDIHQINIGLFDQCVRLTGHYENSVFTIATRDSQITETLVEKLKQVLSLLVSSPMLERSHQELEQDFYRDITQRTKTTIEGLVYTHPSQVSFVYPGEDAVQDVLYLIRERSSSHHIGSPGVSDKSSSLWLYIQCYLLPSDESSSPSSSPFSSTIQPRTIIMTSTHLAIAEEDIVTYPLPDFVRGLPENPCHEILDCRAIECLKRVHLYHSNPHWLSLTFVKEQPELIVDVNMQHFGGAEGSEKKKKVAPEVNMKFYLQSLMERDKLVHMLEKLWKQQVALVGRILDVQKI